MQQAYLRAAGAQQILIFFSTIVDSVISYNSFQFKRGGMLFGGQPRKSTMSFGSGELFGFLAVELKAREYHSAGGWARSECLASELMQSGEQLLGPME
jgi:hypothetical protein